MDPYNQDTVQITAKTLVSNQEEGDGKTVLKPKQHVHNTIDRKSHRKSLEASASSSSQSSDTQKRYQINAQFHAHSGAGTGSANYVYEQRQQHSSNGGYPARDTLNSYNGFQNRNEVGQDDASDLYRLRRQICVRKQTIRLPDQPGVVRQVRHRMLTPEPDILERVYIRRLPNTVIEEIIEQPTTPPPRLQERTIIEPSGPPQIVRKVIRVPPRSQQHEYQQGETLDKYGSLSGVNTPTAGHGAYGAGYGQSGQGYTTNGNYYQTDNRFQCNELQGPQGPQGYGQTGQQRYQGYQQPSTGACFGYTPSTSTSATNNGFYPTQPAAAPSNMPPNMFCFEIGGTDVPGPSSPQTSLCSYGAVPQGLTGLGGFGNFASQGFGGTPGLGALQNFSVGANFGGASAFGAASTGGLGGFSNSGFGSGALGNGGGFGNFGTGGNFGSASFGAQNFGNSPMQQSTPFTGNSSGGAMSFGGSFGSGGSGGCCGGMGGGMSGGLGAYGSAMGGLSLFGGGGSFGGGSFGGGSFGGGSFGGAGFGGGSFGGMNPCLPAAAPPACPQQPIIQYCPVPVPVPQPQPCPVPVQVPVPQPCPVPVPVRECVPVP